jgi:trimethylamine--corrinoid protein Co-methyltransferase
VSAEDYALGPVRPDPGETAVAERIHAASLALLEDPGVRLEHDEIAAMVLKNGGRSGADANVVRIPRAMVEDCLARCPREVALCDRHGGKKVLSAESEPTFWSIPGLKIFSDGQSRPFDSNDMAGFARLLERLENVDVVFGVALDDVIPPARDAVGLRIMAENSTKHLRALCFSPEGAEVMAEMKNVVGDFPWFSIGFTAHGPLRWTNLALEIYRRTAGHGIPATVNGEPMAGVSGPVTLAGAAAVGNAEILAGIVVNQFLEPGRPMIHNLGLAHVFDMKTAVAVTGAPENHLLARAGAALARFYNLPSASWVSTESMCPDEQAALEKMCGWLSHVQSGVSAVWGVGQLESEISISLAQAVIDNEMISYVKRYVRGLAADDEALALDVTREVGIAGSFLDHMHTALNFRSELYLPKTLFRERRVDWEKAGAKTYTQRAEEIARDLSSAPVEGALSEDQAKALRKLTDDFVASVKGS